MPEPAVSLSASPITAPFVSVVVSRVLFFNDTATTEIYTLSLHDALPIYARPDDPAEPLAHRAEPVQTEVDGVQACTWSARLHRSNRDVLPGRLCRAQAPGGHLRGRGTGPQPDADRKRVV